VRAGLKDFNRRGWLHEKEAVMGSGLPVVTRGRLVTALAGVALVALGVSLGPEVEAGSGARSTEASIARARVFPEPWEAEKDLDSEAVQLLTAYRITVPAGGRGTLVTTATLDVRTTRSDWGLIAAGVRREGSRRGTTMRPGPYRITAPRRTTTTLSWIKKGLDPGTTYVIELSGFARDGDGDRRARTSGRKLAFTARAR
jgi:hypothetical protein